MKKLVFLYSFFLWVINEKLNKPSDKVIQLEIQEQERLYLDIGSQKHTKKQKQLLLHQNTREARSWPSQFAAPNNSFVFQNIVFSFLKIWVFVRAFGCPPHPKRRPSPRVLSDAHPKQRPSSAFGYLYYPKRRPSGAFACPPHPKRRPSGAFGCPLTPVC